MSYNIYRDVGCSQEHHLPNCGHFGYAGTYLSEHASWCSYKRKDIPCNCNPTARDPGDTWNYKYENRVEYLEGLLEFLRSQAVYDEQGDAWWQFCFSKHHKSFEEAVRSWKENYDKGGIKKPTKIHPISVG